MPDATDPQVQTEVELAEGEFTYFGEKFAYAEEFPHFAQAEFFMALEEDEVSQTQAMAMALRFALACVRETDRARFRKVSRERNARTEDWMKVFQGRLVWETGRPTTRPTDSSPGPQTAPQSSGTPSAPTSAPTPPAGSVTSLPDVKAAKAATRRPRGDMGLAVARSEGLA